jgi:hypothetical protein
MPIPQDFDTHIAYAAQQRPDGYWEAVQHAMDLKMRFNRRMLASIKEEVAFKKGDLIQVYCNNLAKSISTKHKLSPMWTEPHRVSEQLLNSYELESLDGYPLEGEFHG